MHNLSIIGLGKLGSPMLAVFCEAGFDVIGVDVNAAYVKAINAGQAPVPETGLQATLAKHRGHYQATMDTRAAVRDTDATFVIVPTPTGADGGFVLDYVLPVCHEIGVALRGMDRYHLVVITSTVMPGHMRKICAVLEQISGKRCGADFGLCYSPEFIALGSVIHDFMHPDYALIGAEDEDAGSRLEYIYSRVHDAPAVCMNWINAEIAKIAQNAHITLKITFANQLAQLCSYLPGADVDAVTRALGHDRRIGKRYLKGGVAFGGPCFPRDNRAFNRAAELVGTSLPLAVLTDRLNRASIDELRHTVAAAAVEGDTIGVLGLAYKPGTPVIEESAAITLVQDLAFAFPIIVYDPLAMDEARKVLPFEIMYAESAALCVEQANVVILMLNHREMVQSLLFRDKVLIDPWRIAPQCACRRYVPLGVGPREDEWETVGV